MKELFIVLTSLQASRNHMRDANLFIGDVKKMRVGEIEKAQKWIKEIEDICEEVRESLTTIEYDE